MLSNTNALMLSHCHCERPTGAWQSDCKAVIPSLHSGQALRATAEGSQCDCFGRCNLAMTGKGGLFFAMTNAGSVIASRRRGNLSFLRLLRSKRPRNDT